MAFFVYTKRAVGDRKSAVVMKDLLSCYCLNQDFLLTSFFFLHILTNTGTGVLKSVSAVDK